jgi:uncharacterized protein
MRTPEGGALRTAEGRLRLGWRLLLFTLLVVGGYVALAGLLGGGLSGHALALLVASLGAGWVALGLDGRPPAALGLALHRGAPAEALVGFGVGGGVALMAVVLMALAGAVRWGADEGSLGALLAAAGASLWLLALPAVAEEALLRGYPLQALSEAFGALPALLLTSALFGLLHGWNPEVTAVGVLNTGLAGVFLGALYLRTGSLWWPSGAHLGWNWAHGFVADLPVSGLDLVDTPWIESRTSGPDLLSGGSFGPEGSLFASTALVFATAWVWSTRRLSVSPAARLAPPLAKLREREPRGKG